MIRTDISNLEYHADRKYLTSSRLKMFLSDPEEHYRTYILNQPSEDRDMYARGSYVHAAILEPHTVDRDFAFSPILDKRDPLWAKFKEENKGRVCMQELQKKQADATIELARKAVYTCHKNGVQMDIPILSHYTGGVPEEAHYVDGVLDEIGVKVRCDYHTPYSIEDIKTTSEKLTSTNIRKICDQYGYDLSAALYVDIVEQTTGVSLPFYFTFITFGATSEKDVAVRVKASEAFLVRGRQKYMEALRRISYAMKTDSWLDVREVE